jgi:hypothetical protein
MFRAEVEGWQAHVFGEMGTKKGYQLGGLLPQELTP